MGELFDKLANYGNSGIYPFHMPGHKRQKTVDFNPYKIDITEIEGFDNLHHAEGVLLEAQKKSGKTLWFGRIAFSDQRRHGGHFKCCFCMCEKDRSDCT